MVHAPTVGFDNVTLKVLDWNILNAEDLNQSIKHDADGNVLSLYIILQIV